MLRRLSSSASSSYRSCSIRSSLRVGTRIFNHPTSTSRHVLHLQTSHHTIPCSTYVSSIYSYRPVSSTEDVAIDCTCPMTHSNLCAVKGALRLARTDLHMRHESDGDWMVTNEDGTPATRNTEENSDETTIGQAAMATPAMTSKQQPKPMTQEEKTFLMEQKEGGRILRGPAPSTVYLPDDPNAYDPDPPSLESHREFERQYRQHENPDAEEIMDEIQQHRTHSSETTHGPLSKEQLKREILASQMKAAASASASTKIPKPEDEPIIPL